MLEKKDADNTKRTYKVAKEVFYEYLNQKGIPEPTEKSELAQVLKKFYVEVRKKDGSSYSMEIRFGLKRYLKTVTGFDITNDEGFNEVCSTEERRTNKSATQASDSQCRLEKTLRKCCVQHTKVLCSTSIIRKPF